MPFGCTVPTTASPYFGSASRIVCPPASRPPAARTCASAAAKIAREHLDRQLLREGRDREREQRRAAHREDVVERVRRRDRPVVGRVVDDAAGRSRRVKMSAARRRAGRRRRRRRARARPAGSPPRPARSRAAAPRAAPPSTSRRTRRGGEIGQLDVSAASTSTLPGRGTANCRPCGRVRLGPLSQ